MDKATFGFDPYHILLTGCGLAIIAAYWLPRYFRGREPAASGLLILGGLAVFGLLPGVPDALNPIDRPRVWELASEFAVIIALFGTGLRIDKIRGHNLWNTTIRMLTIAMPLCILSVVVLGLGIGLSLAGSVLLAAVLAPTDPVLQVAARFARLIGGPAGFVLLAEEKGPGGPMAYGFALVTLRPSVYADGPVAVPVNIAVSDGAVVVRTAAYSAMAREVDDSRVALEVDDLDHETRTGWSVLVRGVARVLFEPAPEDAPTAWPTGSKSATVRVRPTKVTGRRLAPPR